MLTCNQVNLYYLPVANNLRRTCQAEKMDINDLEEKVDELISLCDELERKQSIMEADKENWSLERTRLLEKNEIAKSKIEAMIMRLKALEQES